MSEETCRLEQRVADLEKELQLAKLELLESQRIDALRADPDISKLPLALEEYQRYGRQMILEGMGLPGQSEQLTRLASSILTTMYMPESSAKIEESECTSRWSGWSGMPCHPISCCCGNWSVDQLGLVPATLTYIS